MISRYYGQPKNITFSAASNPLAVYGYDYVDIEEVRFNLKKRLEVDADDAYLELSSLNAKVTIDEVNHKFIVILASSDYVNLVKNTTYFMTLNIKVFALPDFIELPMEDRKLKIDYDTNRD